VRFWTERQQRSAFSGENCAGSVFAGWPAMLPSDRCSLVVFIHKANMAGFLVSIEPNRCLKRLTVKTDEAARRFANKFITLSTI